MKNNFYLFTLLALLMFSACKKDKYGNTDIEANTYTVNWNYEDPSYTCVINESLITQDVVDNGAVHVYMSNGNGGWTALPFTIPMDPSYSSTFTPVHYVGGVKVWKTDTDLLTLDPGTTTFKVVIVSHHGLLQNPDLDWTDYEEVEKKLEL